MKKVEMNKVNACRRTTVVGAGPAGLTAAITLARAGWGVTVYEKGPKVGTRFHGDFQGLENWSEEEDALGNLQRLGLQVNFNAQPVHQVVFYGSDLVPQQIQGEEPLFYLIHRGDYEGSLDRGLYHQAVDTGVEFHFNSPARHVAGPAIIATGPRHGDAVAIGYLFDTDLEDMALCILSNRLAPRGYSYLLVSQGRGTLANCYPRSSGDWKSHLEEAVAAFRRLVPLDMRRQRFFSGYANFFMGRLVNGEKLYVGEAAGLQDALWGFGLRYAITSGYLAAQSRLTGQVYDELIRVHLRSSQRASLVNRGLWELLGDRLRGRLPYRAARWADPKRRLGEIIGPRKFKTLLYPLPRLILHWRSRYRDTSCGDDHCTCVWCVCKANGRYQPSQCAEVGVEPAGEASACLQQSGTPDLAAGASVADRSTLERR